MIVCLPVCLSLRETLPPTPRPEAKRKRQASRGPFILPLSCQTRPARVWSSARDLQRDLQTVWTTVEYARSFSSLPAAIRDLFLTSCCEKSPGSRSGQEAREEPTTPLGSIARGSKRYAAPFSLPSESTQEQEEDQRVGKSMASRRKVFGGASARFFMSV